MTDSGDQAAHALWLLLALVLVASGMVGRRIPVARLIGWSAAWATLFLGLFILFRWFEPEIIAWQHSRRAGQIGVTTGIAGVVRIPVSRDGHYWVDASVNDERVRFLVDSGASITAVSETTAKRIGLAEDPMGRTLVVQTANGPVTARRSIVADLRVGGIQATDLPVIMSPAFGDVNVLGMNFLGKLDGWRVSDGYMVLEGA